MLRNLSLVALLLVVMGTPALAQTPPSNPFFIFDGSADAISRYNLKEDGLYMVFRPDLCRGLTTIEDWSFVVQDLSVTTKETVTLEVRKDDTKGLPGVTTADVVWSATFNNIDFATTPTPGLGSFVVTPYIKIKLPSTEEAYWAGFHWPAMTMGPSGPTDGMLIQTSGPRNNTGCVEAPRGYGAATNPFNGELCAGIDFTQGSVAAGGVNTNIALFSMLTFTEPTLQPFASNFGYVTQTPNINFCYYNQTATAWLPAPQNAPEDNFGYAGIWPDMTDVDKLGRKDDFGWLVTANQFATNGGVALLFLSDQTMDPGYINTGWDTLFLSPASRWFALATMTKTLTVSMTTTPPSATASFGPFDLGPARGAWVASVGPLHAQAVVVDGKNLNNIKFSNMTTTYFDWLGSSEVTLDNNTTTKTQPYPNGTQFASVHSVRGNLVVQVELNSQPIGQKYTIACGCTKNVFGLPPGGSVRVSLDPKSKGAKYGIKFN